MLKFKKNLLKISLLILMIISIAVTFSGCMKKENEENKENNNDKLAYEQPLKDYFEGIKNKDISQVIKAFPEFMKMSENITQDDINELYSQYEQLYGANIKIDYQLGEATTIGEDELKELKEQIIELYQDAGNIELTEGYSVPVTVTITGDGQKSAENTEETSSEDNTENSNVEEDNMYVLQCNGNWYIM